MDLLDQCDGMLEQLLINYRNNNNFILMDRLKEKEMDLLRQLKKIKGQQQDEILERIIKQEETLQIILKYTQQYFKNNSMENVSEYSPIQISRLVFDKELQQIKQYFQRFPDNQVKIEHFIIIMMKVMKFFFERSPLYMVGLKDMFYEIVEEGHHVINYPQFFKYILGELVMMKEEEQNTEFQVQILQKKKQDYLMHDNGIKRIKYSKDLKIVFSLDERSNAIKIYDSEMKNIFKFSAKKQKHGNKFPWIVDFDYSEISSRLGLLFSDETISTIHIPNLLKQSPTEFQSLSFNEMVFPLQEKMTQIYFIQMLDKWMTIDQAGLAIYLYDLQKSTFHAPNQKIFTKLKLNLNDLTIRKVVQIVPLSCICIIAGNQVNFYNQNLSDLIFKKFIHVEDIEHFKYSDEKNQFYLCGKQKSITIFSMNRNGYPSKLMNISINKIIADFQLFPYYDTIVISDENNDIRLLHEPSKTIYQSLNYSHIVKTKDKLINLFKISKNQFCLYQTYLIVMNQEKIAIEKDTEYSFLPYYHIDNKKDELYISVNHQIINFSLISGQIRKNFSLDSSNLQKHHSFFIQNKTPLFILDHQFNIYEVYAKDQGVLGQNQNYRKKVNIQELVNSFYDRDLHTFIMVSKHSINQIRNDSHNNFNLINTYNLEGFNAIIKSNFCQRSKYLSFLTNNQLVYLMKNYEITIERCYKFVFPKDNLKHEESMIINYHYVSQYDMFVILTNKNEVYFVNRFNGNQFYFDIQDHMPSKIKHLKFINFRYQKIEETKGIYEHYVLISDETGFIIQFPLIKIYHEFHLQSSCEQEEIKPMIRETHLIESKAVTIDNIYLNKNQRLKRRYDEIGLLKAHDKAIVMSIKIKLQIITTLTISIDGYIKLWNKSFQCLFNLKIPSLMKCLWNMKQIQNIKNKNSIAELLKLFKEHFNGALMDKNSPIQNWNKSKKLRNKEGQLKDKINLNDPFKIEIENKDIQDIVMQRQDYSTFYNTSKKLQMHTQRQFNTTEKIYPHPWRTRKEFVNMYDKASPINKYKLKIPKDLLDLRTSLDMTEKLLQTPDYKQAQKLLPQLSFYEPEKAMTDKKQKKIDNPNEQEGQNFESCLYVKSINRKKKKINELDQIDKEFKKKELLMTARKWVPKKQKTRNPSVSQIKQQIMLGQKEGKLDPIKAIFNIFQAHNRQVMQHRKGRLIKIPKINQTND